MPIAMTTTVAIVAKPIFLAALLYPSVGHAKAGGYLAVMALMGVSATDMEPMASILKIFVATIVTAEFRRAGPGTVGARWPWATPRAIARKIHRVR